MKKNLVGGFLSIALTLLVVRPTFAHHQQQVLGIATVSADTLQNLQIPLTSQGPGLILPDSPLYFLDQLKQEFRLLLAFTPEAKAKVHVSIAGERMAELRFMVQRNNKRGIETDLQGIQDNLLMASNNLLDAQLAGKDTKDLAKTLNTTIKEKQQVLDLMESQATGDTKTRVKAAANSLTTAKVQVEDALPEQELANEIRDDLQRQVNNRVREASQSAAAIVTAIGELQKGVLGTSTQEPEKKKQEQLSQILQKASEEAQVAAKAAQNAALQFEKANAVRNQPAEKVASSSSK